MAARIPEDKIEEVRTTADIVEIIGGYVPLKRRGRNYMASCPFHDDRTPSFSVAPDKQIFHCFGCGIGGNVFSFIMEYEKVSFIEAVRMLADRYGIALPKYQPDEDDSRERLLYANEVAADLFVRTMQRPEYKAKIGKYLRDNRGLSEETIERFKIGLAPEGWTELIKFAKSKDLKIKELAEAGLVIKSDKSGDYYDRFRLRLMVPIFNLGGRIIAFGGRALRKGENAKYMNSPETPVYNKSTVLYGLHESKTAIRRAESVVLVEGYFDFLSLYQAGIDNVVAVSGTAFTARQARLLSRYASKAYLLFDSDSAGRSAALRAIEHFFNFGIEPVVAEIPAPHDPDSYVREFGADALREILARGVPYLTYRFGGFDVRAMTMQEKESLAREVRSLAEKISDDLRREIFIGTAAEKLGLSSAVLSPQPEEYSPAGKQGDRARNVAVLESEFLAICLNHPEVIESVRRDISPDDLHREELQGLYRLMLDMFDAEGEIDVSRLIEAAGSPKEKSALAFISTLEYGETELENMANEYRHMLIKIKRQRLLDRLRKKMAEAEARSDGATVSELEKEIKYLLEKLK